MTVLSANWIPAFWNGGISPSFRTRRVIASMCWAKSMSSGLLASRNTWSMFFYPIS